MKKSGLKLDFLYCRRRRRVLSQRATTSNRRRTLLSRKASHIETENTNSRIRTTVNGEPIQSASTLFGVRPLTTNKTNAITAITRQNIFAASQIDNLQIIPEWDSCQLFFPDLMQLQREQ